jgi:hypothetical protein
MKKKIQKAIQTAIKKDDDAMRLIKYRNRKHETKTA